MFHLLMIEFKILNRHGLEDGVYQDTIDIVEYLKSNETFNKLEKECLDYFSKNYKI